MRHLLTQILIRSVTALSLSLSSMVPSTCLSYLWFLQLVSLQVGVIPNHPLPISFPKDEGFCSCLLCEQSPAICEMTEYLDINIAHCFGEHDEILCKMYF
jgi:hypothetical protein